MSPKKIIGFILIFIVVIFGLQNIQSVQIKFLIWDIEMSRVFMVLIIFCIGFLSGYLFKTIK